MSKKRQKRLVRIVAVDLDDTTQCRLVHFRYNIGTIPYKGAVHVEPTEDAWDKINEFFDSETYALLQQEREV